MRWIKHFSDFSQTEAMTDVLEKLGPTGYGATWLLLERIAASWDSKSEPEIKLSVKAWKKACGLSPRKLQELLEILEIHNMVFAKLDENKLTLIAPILVNIRDEWSKRKAKDSGAAQESLPSDSGTETEQQSEEENKEQNKTHPPPLSLNLRTCLKPVLDRHGIQEYSERGRRLIRYVEKMDPKNPGGYLETILQQNSGCYPKMSDTVGRYGFSEDSGEPIAVNDVLSRMDLLQKR